ncbi:MAG: hypothetical protein H6937_03885 [Burkholderiales bacterium]|nr:hypothetical protein [Burkholderiales bacterium]MDR4515862.1 hypothetical protein [Nitrosomonas sp.]
MASSNNALWIGAIVIVAALTAVELMSTKEESASKSIDNDTVAGSTSPVSPQFDAGQIATGSAEAPGNETALAESVEPGFQFETESEFASDLIVNLDNPQANVAAIAESQQSEPTIDAADNAEEMLTTSLPIDNTQAAKAESVAAAPTETAVQSIEKTIAEKSAPIEVTVDTSLARAVEHAEAEETPVHAATSSKISQHLAAAEKAIKALRMTTPAGDNAYEHYQSVLAIDPNNAEARAGIEKMVDMYVHFSEKAITDNQLNTARVYLRRAENLLPGSPKLNNLRAKLN